MCVCGTNEKQHNNNNKYEKQTFGAENTNTKNVFRDVKELPKYIIWVSSRVTSPLSCIGEQTATVETVEPKGGRREWFFNCVTSFCCYASSTIIMTIPISLPLPLLSLFILICSAPSNSIQFSFISVFSSIEHVGWKCLFLVIATTATSRSSLAKSLPTPLPCAFCVCISCCPFCMTKKTAAATFLHSSQHKKK